MRITVTYPVTNAMTGEKVQVPLIEGDYFPASVVGAYRNWEFTIPGKGLWADYDAKKRGDLVVNFKVTYPSNPLEGWRRRRVKEALDGVKFEII